MKKVFYRTALLCITAAALLISCDWDIFESTSLWGTWETNNATYPGYYGTLIIDSSTITIRGYTGSIGLNNESTRPFKGFTKDDKLYCNFEKDGNGTDYTGTLNIKDRGDWQPGIPFKFWHNNHQPRLTFYFDDEPQTL